MAFSAAFIFVGCLQTSAALKLSQLTSKSSEKSLDSSLPPKPRYCILDEPPPMKSFLEGFENAVNKGALWEFLNYDRDTGRSALKGLSKSISTCPEFPIMKRADRACITQSNNQYVKLDTPLDQVRTIFASPYLKGNPISCRRECEASRVCRTFDEIGDECNLLNFINENETTKALFGGAHKLRLIAAGADHFHLSAAPVQMIVGTGFFKYVFWEGNDYDAEGDEKNMTRFETYPKGLSMHYMLGRERWMYEAAKHARLDSKRGVLAAFGARYTKSPGWYDEDMDKLQVFLDKSTDFVNHTAIDLTEYDKELSKYRFFLAPKGNGLQSPKFTEALLQMTIPITLRYKAFQDLHDYGFPFVVVDDWDEITPAKLDEWWAELSPKLETARWITTVKGVESLLYGTCYED